jgi:hypothetical protein
MLKINISYVIHWISQIPVASSAWFANSEPLTLVVESQGHMKNSGIFLRFFK